MEEIPQVLQGAKSLVQLPRDVLPCGHRPQIQGLLHGPGQRDQASRLVVDDFVNHRFAQPGDDAVRPGHHPRGPLLPREHRHLPEVLTARDDLDLLVAPPRRQLAQEHAGGPLPHEVELRARIPAADDEVRGEVDRVRQRGEDLPQSELREVVEEGRRHHEFVVQDKADLLLQHSRQVVQDVPSASLFVHVPDVVLVGEHAVGEHVGHAHVAEGHARLRPALEPLGAEAAVRCDEKIQVREDGRHVQLADDHQARVDDSLEVVGRVYVPVADGSHCVRGEIIAGYIEIDATPRVPLQRPDVVRPRLDAWIARLCYRYEAQDARRYVCEQEEGSAYSGDLPPKCFAMTSGRYRLSN
mmetsp:Transcript_104375/g.319574  ORF Transcript_104375/g.319574 Transcript_104375/m.319574 type:complete len:355 (-) Transcript_104375:939-2003(-)